MSTAYAALACSPGVAVGPAWRPRRPGHPAPPAAGATTAGPLEVRAAFAAAAARLETLTARCRRDGAPVHADILEAEALIARDPAYVEDVVAVVARTAVDATTALREVTERHASVLEGLGGVLGERAADVREVGRLVEDELTGRLPPTPPAGPFVLLADEATAPVLLTYAEEVVGVVSLRGGAGSHASIIARSLGIPLVSEVPSDVLDVPDGVPVLVDGDTGTVEVRPDATTLAEVNERTADSDGAVAAARLRPTRTSDGVEVTLLANVASRVEARRALDAGAAGVGLLRTELSFLEATDWPTAAQHEAALRPTLEVLRGRPVTVRLLDFTNDKTPPFLAGRPDVSSLRLLLGNREALDDQLRAALRAGAGTDLRLMVPMVTSREEMLTVHQRLGHAAEQVGCDVPQLGAMLELPAAIEALPSLLDVSDFFSLGTNDLTAAVLGLARTDPRLTPAMTADPAVMTLVRSAAELTHAAGRPLSVCGDAAADPAVLPLLLAAGIRVFSVAVSRLDAVRALVRQHPGKVGGLLLATAVGRDG